MGSGGGDFHGKGEKSEISLVNLIAKEDRVNVNFVLEGDGFQDGEEIVSVKVSREDGSLDGFVDFRIELSGEIIEEMGLGFCFLGLGGLEEVGFEVVSLEVDF